MKKSLRKSALTLAVLASFSLTGCFDTNTGASNATETVTINKTTTGVITAFGSVFINGVEYETDTASINIDGVANSTGDDSGLKLGMVVTLSGDATDGKGAAVSIQFDNELEGIVTEIPVTDTNGLTTGVLKIMGVTINSDEDTVFESQVVGVDTIAGIQRDNIIEVSGHSAGDGVVWATRIEVKKAAIEVGDEIDLRGLVTGLNEVDSTFTIGDMTVSYSADVLDDDITTLANDMLVKVKGDGLVDGVLVATEVELKNRNRKAFETDGDDDEIEVEGVITQAAVDNAFAVNGSIVTFDTATRIVHGTAATLADDTIVVGLKVKVKGVLDVDGNFLAETIVFKPSGDLKMEGVFSSADVVANTITMFGLTIYLDNDTFVEDDRDESRGNRVKYLFGADDLVEGDFLKIKAYKNSNGELVASKMKRKPAKDSSKLEGKVDSIDATVPTTIILAGVTVDLSATNITPVLNSKLELKGSYDATTNIFTATDGEESDDDRPYIGGEDGEEDERDERRDRNEDREDDDRNSSDDDDMDETNEMNDDAMDDDSSVL